MKRILQLARRAASTRSTPLTVRKVAGPRLSGRADKLRLAVLLATLLGGGLASGGTVRLDETEAVFADFNDATGALALIDSGLQETCEGRNRQQWQQLLEQRRATLNERLPQLAAGKLVPLEARAVSLMRQTLSAAAPDADQSATCGMAQRRDIALGILQQALYACFVEIADQLKFENTTLTRVAALDQLARIDSAQRRQRLFLAFTPLWRAINGNDEADSPYRRMLALAAAQSDSPIDAAAHTLGIDNATMESWLLQILETWRISTDDIPVEPWDYRYRYGAAERELAIGFEQMQPLNLRFYRDLGADLQGMDVIQDLTPRPGKAPLAYTDYVRRGRVVDGRWQPTLVHVSASYDRGGLGLLNELVHENGHAVHMMALHTRPAFMDLGDAVFYEAIADVPSWSVYEPAWQQKYLGRSVSLPAAMQALYSNVMLDVAWGLFDLRMLRDPRADPNAVWTEITHRYLHVVAHPELSWWAVRVQLVDSPGYMVNYGMGSVITADIRAHIAAQIGSFDAGNANWYAWWSQQLASGQQYETRELLRHMLGRPVSSQHLLEQVRRAREPRS